MQTTKTASQLIFKSHVWSRQLFTPSQYLFSTVQKKPSRQPTPEQQMQAIFASDSTFQLLKKLMIYRMMSSNFFINNALGGMRLSYKILGRTLTNFAINKTAGSIFTSGETLQSLVADIEVLEKKGIHGVANYVVEGLHEMHEPTI